MSVALTPAQLTEEQHAFDQEVLQVEQWWASDRFRLVTRPYSAADGESGSRVAVGQHEH